jgi:integrase
MALVLFRREKKSGNWIIRGSVRGTPVYESTGTSNREAAEALRIRREKELLDVSIYGREAVSSFADAVVSYLEFKPRSDDTKRQVHRLLGHFETAKLRSIDQAAADAMCKALVPSGSLHGKIGLITMLNAVLEHAAKRKMCARPLLDKPKAPQAKVAFLLPEQATALVRAANLHLRPLIVFLISVGCRPGEALELDWLDVDLRGAQATLTLGKMNKKRWTVDLRPVAVQALTCLPHRTGPVFRTWITAGDDPRGRVGPGYSAGRFIGAWETACAKAGLPGQWVGWIGKTGRKEKRFDPLHTPYSTRHTFATWHRCAHKDLQDLRDEIGWTTTRMGERYGKKMSRVYEPEVLAWWNGEVDLGLGEVEEVSCKIRAATALEETPKRRKAK